MICLGIESTAHTFGVGICKNKNILANIKDAYTTKSGGIIPLDSAKHHKDISKSILDLALKEAKIELKDIDIISYSQGPGLSPCLLVGMHFAKQLAEKLKKPLVPVNHCIAHLEIGKLLTGAKDPVLLYASGANTQVIAYSSGKYRIFGETLDMGIGNFIDSFARYCGLGFPGGPKIAELANKSKTLIELPYSVKGMDVSFSGLLTNLKQKYDKASVNIDNVNVRNVLKKVERADNYDKEIVNVNNKVKGVSKENTKANNNINYNLYDLSFSLQETAFAMLVEVAERAMAHCRKNELLLGGGVACNKRLQEMCSIMCKERKAKSFCPENQFLVDNPAMIAYSGILRYKEGKTINIKKADIKPYERTDDLIVR